MKGDGGRGAFRCLKKLIREPKKRHLDGVANRRRKSASAHVSLVRRKSATNIDAFPRDAIFFDKVSSQNRLVGARDCLNQFGQRRGGGDGGVHCDAMACDRSSNSEENGGRKTDGVPW